MAAMARIPREELPAPSTAEMTAVDTLYQAFMALNAAGGKLANQYASQHSPMELTRRASLAAIELFPGVSRSEALGIWETMMSSGETFSYVYVMWVHGEI